MRENVKEYDRPSETDSEFRWSMKEMLQMRHSIRRISPALDLALS